MQLLERRSITVWLCVKAFISFSQLKKIMEVGVRAICHVLKRYQSLNNHCNVSVFFPILAVQEQYSWFGVQRYIPSEGERSNLVQTSWAMMGLIHAGQV